MPASDPLALWDYPLPPDRIARYPSVRRDASRLLVLPRHGEQPPCHRRFSELPQLLRRGDLLVVNDTRVMAARLRARRSTGGAVELVLLEPGPGPVPALARPARKLEEGERLTLERGGATVVRAAVDGVVVVALDRPPAEVMAEQGELPLPPYLRRSAEATDAERYQTVYAGPLGAAAAPTAGLHFTTDVLQALEVAGIGLATVTLHVGIGTFRPLRSKDLERGRLHPERYLVPADTARRVIQTRREGGRVIAVGTTAARTLEAATSEGDLGPRPRSGTTELFIQPPYVFRGLDGLITNFHLPRSSLLMLVGALVGRERLLRAYHTAIERGYRFYSYGDAMLVL